MKTFLSAMRNRLICTAICLAFLVWHSHSKANLVDLASTSEASIHVE